MASWSTSMANMVPDAAVPPDDDCARGMLVTIWTMFGICAIVVTLRIWAAIAVSRKISLADHLMLGAVLLSLISNICTTVSAHYGLGQHIVHLDRLDVANAMKWEIISSSIAVMCPILGRISFAVWMLQFVRTSPVKEKLLHFCIWSSLIVNILVCILMYAQCDNVDKVWDFQAPGKCWNLEVQAQAGYFQGGFNTLVDLVLTILPIWVVRVLRIPRKTKIGLMVLLGFSLFAAVASAFKTIQLHSIGPGADMTYSFCKFQPWFRAESAVVIIGASIPHCRALFRSRQRRGITSLSYLSNEHQPETTAITMPLLSHGRSFSHSRSLSSSSIFTDAAPVRTIVSHEMGGTTLAMANVKISR